MKLFNVEQFIQEFVTRRSVSLFHHDLTQHHEALANEINYRSVLVIGGAGTIGGSFVKAILKFRPNKLFVVDLNENGLTELVRDLRSSTAYNIPDDFKTYPIDFASPVFERILKNEGPFDIVANFAAHKHVRSEKDHYSIEAMIENNVLKAKKLLDLLLELPPKHFFCVSTDKAANPVNVMGASKKLMEETILACSEYIPITTARFANVAFSNGSLLAGFMERLAKRQPLSSPSDVRRYFVSPQESGELCLIACVLGASSDIFFPKLMPDEMITFAEIGNALLQAHGYEPDYCQTEQEARLKATQLADHTSKYPVYYFLSDTTGEKMYEEFYTEGELLDVASFKELGVIKNAPRRTMNELNDTFEQINTLFRRPTLTKEMVIELLTILIPNFNHVETGKNLDQRM